MYGYQLEDIIKSLDEMSKKAADLKPKDMYEVVALNNLKEAISICISRVYALARISSFPHV